ncbi:MAG TPA: RES family NAD+ phosphorylase, partial [Chitinophagaceae bacterium]|nr:RES family NAD+ phosphorylase [Chitinophagaceae bacterium]
MLVYRITHKSHSKALFAPGIKGRWNSTGKKVVYCAESVALAFLENMVRRQGVGFNRDFKTMIIDVPPGLAITVIKAGDLKEGWRNFRDYSMCQPRGDQWYDAMQTPVLQVPSAVLPEGSNYVINTEHPGYKHITLLAVTDLVPDERIEDIL